MAYKFEDAIMKCDFQRNQIDPWMFLRQKGTEKVYIRLYVDDGIITGDETLMIKVIHDF